MLGHGAHLRCRRVGGWRRQRGRWRRGRGVRRSLGHRRCAGPRVAFDHPDVAREPARGDTPGYSCRRGRRGPGRKCRNTGNTLIISCFRARRRPKFFSGFPGVGWRRRRHDRASPPAFLPFERRPDCRADGCSAPGILLDGRRRHSRRAHPGLQRGRDCGENEGNPGRGRRRSTHGGSPRSGQRAGGKICRSAPGRFGGSAWVRTK